MGQAQVCATVAAKSMLDLRAQRDRAQGADLVELRLDAVGDLDVDGALAGRTCPVLVTCRPTWEGGHFVGSEEERHRILRRAFELGAEWVDLEWRGGFEKLIAERHGQNVVLSMHDFNGMPEDLDQRYRAMRGSGAEVVKLAVQPHSATDIVRLLRLGQAKRNERLVVVGMGQIGVPTRLLPSHFGSCWTYAGAGVAPGQIPLKVMIEEFRCRQITAATAIYGVAGAPIAHSLSPSMHNRGLSMSGRDAVYVPFEATGAEDLMRLADALGVSGLSVTAPFKESILSYVGEVEAVGQRVGAVNTLKAFGRNWSARNTDVPGFLTPLDQRGGLRGVRASILGAGGSARAVAVGLASRGADVTVCARQRGRAAVVAELVGGTVGCLPPTQGSWDLLVNTTPVGTSPHEGETPVPAAMLAGGSTVYDLVYNPGQTRLMREAAAAGCETIGGLAMLVAQAVRQFEWWFDVTPPEGLFRSAALEALSARDVMSQESSA